jgi:hypothetical protein
MKTALSATIAAAAIAIAAPAAAQTCDALVRADDFGSLAFGMRLEAVPQGMAVAEQCEAGVSSGTCVLRDPDGVTYTLYDGYVISKFVFVGQGPLPWGFEDGVDRAEAASLLSRQTEVSASGVYSPDNQLHVRSRFGCGEGVFGQVFARYSGNRLVAVGLEIDS